jgi:hypothetical protein
MYICYMYTVPTLSSISTYKYVCTQISNSAHGYKRYNATVMFLIYGTISNSVWTASTRSSSPSTARSSSTPSASGLTGR